MLVEYLTIHDFLVIYVYKIIYLFDAVSYNKIWSHILT
jgi:hypothetical protein